jgi:hypothetical protein
LGLDREPSTERMSNDKGQIHRRIAAQCGTTLAQANGTLHGE